MGKEPSVLRKGQEEQLRRRMGDMYLRYVSPFFTVAPSYSATILPVAAKNLLPAGQSL